MKQPHRPLLKVAINTVLRFFQLRFTDRPWLIYSMFEDDELLGYGFGRIQINPPISQRPKSPQSIPTDGLKD